MLFKVLSGFHWQDGKVYGPGDIVESKRVLDEIFRNKFSRQDKIPPAGLPTPAPLPAPPKEAALPGLSAKHFGRGRWAVVDASGNRVDDNWYSKEEAQQKAVQG